MESVKPSPIQVWEKVWKVAATMVGDFSANDLATAGGVAPQTAITYLRRWKEEGKVNVSHREGNRIFYAVARKDALPLSPMVPEKATKHGNMWRSVRMLKSFTPTDVVAHSNTPETEVTQPDAMAYCQMLMRAGYLRAEKKAQPGRREARYRLIRDTGPRPPREKRVRGVYDDNLSEFTHLAGDLK